MFATVTVEERNCRFLVDTGSSVSILAKNIFDSLGGDTSQLKEVAQTLTTADGRTMKVLGSTEFAITIGSYETQLSLMIADINGLDGILGMDFLSEPEITINVGQCKLHINGQTITLFRETKFRCARVKLGRKGCGSPLFRSTY